MHCFVSLGELHSPIHVKRIDINSTIPITFLPCFSFHTGLSTFECICAQLCDRRTILLGIDSPIRWSSSTAFLNTSPHYSGSRLFLNVTLVFLYRTHVRKFHHHAHYSALFGLFGLLLCIAVFHSRIAGIFSFLFKLACLTRIATMNSDRHIPWQSLLFCPTLAPALSVSYRDISHILHYYWLKFILSSTVNCCPFLKCHFSHIVTTFVVRSHFDYHLLRLRQALSRTYPLHVHCPICFRLLHLPPSFKLAHVHSVTPFSVLSCSKAPRLSHYIEL